MKKSFKFMFGIIIFLILLSAFQTFAYADLISPNERRAYSTESTPYITELMPLAIVLTIICTVILMTAAILFFNLKSAEKVQNAKVGNNDKNGTVDINKKKANLKKTMYICGFILIISVVIIIIATHV